MYIFCICYGLWVFQRGRAVSDLVTGLSNCNLEDVGILEAGESSGRSTGKLGLIGCYTGQCCKGALWNGYAVLCLPAPKERVHCVANNVMWPSVRLKRMMLPASLVL